MDENNNVRDNESGRKCFIITPIGNDNSDIFRKAKGVIESVIKPILRDNGFTDIKPAYEIMESGMIGNQIIDRIVNDDLVVANLSGNNPNVMYELAIRHATAKPIIHICEKGTVLPFDIKDNRTSFYNDDMLGVQELRNEFENYVSCIDFTREYIDNPIYSGIEMANIINKIGRDGRQTEAELLQKILDKVSNEAKTQLKIEKSIKYEQKLFDNSDFFMFPGCEKGLEWLAFLMSFDEWAERHSISFVGKSDDRKYYRIYTDWGLTIDEIEKKAHEISESYNTKIVFVRYSQI